MWNSDLHYNLIQKGAGNYEDSEESEESEVSSQGTESSQEETESLEPWSRIFDEAEKRHETQLNALISEYEGNGDSENVARVKAENALLPVYRKEPRKVYSQRIYSGCVQCKEIPLPLHKYLRYEVSTVT